MRFSTGTAPHNAAAHVSFAMVTMDDADGNEDIDTGIDDEDECATMAVGEEAEADDDADDDEVVVDVVEDEEDVDVTPSIAAAYGSGTNDRPGHVGKTATGHPTTLTRTGSVNERVMSCAID
jgi:hypothetical protein